MKILVTGKTGQVGQALEAYAEDFDLKTICVSRNDWDLSDDLNDFEKIVLKSKPDLVINAAAYTNVDGAEKHKELSYAINAQAPLIMARVCNKFGIPLFHISTDYIFNGEFKSSLNEEHPADPLNYYGKTKLIGENNIIQSHPQHLILRTSSVFSKNGLNFMNKILGLAHEKDNVSIVSDQFCGPTSAKCIARELLLLATKYDATKSLKWGVYHYSGKPGISWFEFANFILNAAWEYKIIEKMPIINPMDTLKMKSLAKRPKYPILNCSKYINTFERNLCDWREDIIQIIKYKKNSIHS